MATDPSPFCHPAVREFDDALAAALDEHGVALYPSRALSLQRAAAVAFGELEEIAVNLKRSASSDGDENAAARLLMGECFADGLKSRLNMWIAFRENEMDEAWGWLVHGQNALNAAVRAHRSGRSVFALLSRDARARGSAFSAATFQQHRVDHQEKRVHSAHVEVHAYTSSRRLLAPNRG